MPPHDRRDRDAARRSQPAPLPLGPGVVARYLRIDERDVVRLGHIVSGYDGLASIHGDGVHTVLVTVATLAPELDALLDEIRAEGIVRFELIAPR